MNNQEENQEKYLEISEPSNASKEKITWEEWVNELRVCSNGHVDYGMLSEDCAKAKHPKLYSYYYIGYPVQDLLRKRLKLHEEDGMEKWLDPDVDIDNFQQIDHGKERIISKRFRLLESIPQRFVSQLFRNLWIATASIVFILLIVGYTNKKLLSVINLAIQNDAVRDKNLRRTRWREYLSPDDRFSILFPGMPDKTTTSRKTSLGEVIANSLVVSPSEGATYMLIYINYPKNVNVTDPISQKEMLEGFNEENVKEHFSRSIQKEFSQSPLKQATLFTETETAEIRGSGFSGKEFTLKGITVISERDSYSDDIFDLRLRVRVYPASNSLYLLGVLTLGENAVSFSDEEKFIGSFKVLDTPGYTGK